MCIDMCFKSPEKDVPSDKAMAEEFLRQAANYQNNGKREQARMYYREGLRFLNSAIDEERNVDTQLEMQKMFNTNHRYYRSLLFVNGIGGDPVVEKIVIKENSTGFGYHSIFSRYLDDTVIEVNIDETYLNNYHQYMNLVRFCDLLVKCCNNLRKINVRTKNQDPQSQQWFQTLATDLQKNHNVILEIKYAPQMHDRRIVLSNGWEFILGKGLHIYQNIPKGAVIGKYDYDLRKCVETTIDIIFHQIKK